MSFTATAIAIDTCLSIFVNRFNESHKYANDLTMLGKYYSEYMQADGLLEDGAADAHL